MSHSAELRSSLVTPHAPDIASLIAGSHAPLVVANREGIRFVVLNRPDARNALTRAMRADFAALMAATGEDDAVRAVVLTGAGDCFSAGVDLKDRIPGAPPVEPNPAAALRSLAKPTIAAIDGFCITGGLEMALSCDFAIATDAARFADTHCRVGLFPRWGGGRLLASAIGVRRARQMMLAGEMIDAGRALAWGLVNEIAPRQDLLARAHALALAMAAQAGSQPLSYGLHAELLDGIDAAPDTAGVEARLLARFDAAGLPNPTLPLRKGAC